MHTLVKIKIFRCALWITYPIALLLLYPIVVLKKKKNTKYFFLFDRYELGGAQRVHIDILQSIKEQNKQVYFTRLSKNQLLKEEFYTIPNTTCEDIHVWCDNLLFRIFSLHYFAFYINRHKDAQVFSANSTFFYDLLPFLGKKVIKIELLHNFTYGKKGMEFFGLGNYKYLDTRLCVDFYTAQNIKEQYQKYGVPDQYAERIKVIEPGVDVPAQYNKELKRPLIVFYAGRGGPQKRIYLLDRIAAQCTLLKLPVVFHFAGTIENELSDLVKQHSILHGIIDKNAMNDIYKSAHVIMMTSAYEGFPMFIKEGMAYGCIPVVTALEGNKTHLTEDQNALLLPVDNEEMVVSDGVAALVSLVNDGDNLRRLSISAYEYANSHFNRTTFMKIYKGLLTRSQI